MLLEYFERRPPGRLPDPQRLDDHGSNQIRIAKRGERNKMSAARKAREKATRHLHREAGLADPAWPRDCYQAHIRTQQKFLDDSHFFFPPHKPGPLHGKIRGEGHYRLNLLLGEAVAYGPKFAREISAKAVTCRTGLRPCERVGCQNRGPFLRFTFEPLQMRANIGGMLEAPLAVFFQRPCDDFVQSGGVRRNYPYCRRRVD